MATYEELTKRIQDLEKDWNGLDLAPAMDIFRLYEERAKLLIDSGACCGEYDRVEVVAHGHEGTEIDRYVVFNCRRQLGHPPCNLMQVKAAVELLCCLNTSASEAKRESDYSRTAE